MATIILVAKTFIRMVDEIENDFLNNNMTKPIPAAAKSVL